MNRVAIDVPVIAAMTIIWMHGGTRMPMADAAEAMLTAWEGW